MIFDAVRLHAFLWERLASRHHFLANREWSLVVGVNGTITPDGGLGDRREASLEAVAADALRRPSANT